MISQAQIEEELTRQVWGGTDQSVSNARLGDEQAWSSKPTLDTNKPLPPRPSQVDFVNEYDHSWISVEKAESDEKDESDDFGEFESADLGTPWLSSQPRGFLCSTQNIDPFVKQEESESEDSDEDNILSYESSTRTGYAPLIKGESSSTSSPQTRHGTSVQRMWAASKLTFAKWGSIREANSPKANSQKATAAWKISFAAKEHDELARAVKTSRKVPMIFDTDATLTQGGGSSSS